MENSFVKGYATDAAVDIVMEEDGSIIPGFNKLALPVGYTPLDGEVAILSARTSTQNAGIFVPMNIIDPHYSGKLSVWVFNCSGMTYHYKRGDRLFSVVNLQLAPTRVLHNIVNTGNRGKNKLGSSGGQSNG